MIYVDDLVEYNVTGVRRGAWCHMWTDGDLEELHVFAILIGLKLEWFQDKPRFKHYDLRPTKRQRAIREGARYIRLRDYLVYGGYKE